jgi:hypothetical protein
MKTISRNRVATMLILLAVVSAAVSCKKTQDAKLPVIAFKTGGNYTSTDGSVTTSDVVNVGITADKNEADLKTFKIYSSTGSAALSLKKTFYLTPDEKSHYDKDYQFTPQSKNSYETWKFEITDAAGNVNSVSFKITIN